MRIDWDTPVDVLMHGDNIRYIDLDEDEIMHWKYIKREKLSNGKYRYYYDQSELDQAKAEADAANNVLYNMEKVDAKIEAGKSGKLGPLANAVTNSETYRKKFAEAEKHAEEATKRYQKMAITSFPARIISKGFVKVANFFTDLFSRYK